MSALPFFTMTPIQPASAPAGTALSPHSQQSGHSQPSSTLGSTLNESGNSSLTSMEMEGETGSEQLEQGLSFWQTLQHTTELNDLTQGQEFAGLTPLSSTVEEEMTDAIAPILSPLVQPEIQERESLIDTQMTSPLNPWQVPQPQNQAENVSMDSIESQRAAAPIYQAVGDNEGEPSVQAQTNAQTVMQGLTPVEYAVNVQTQVDSQTVDMAKVPLNQSSSPLNHPIMDDLTLEGGEVGEGLDVDLGLSLKELGLNEKSANIHEKPLTLQSTETTLKTQMSQVSQMAEVVQANSADADMVQSSSNHNQREQMIQNKVLAENQAPLEKSNSQFKLDVPPQSPQWSEQIARRITIMSNDQIQSARIQLDPPELGLLEIKIKVQQDQVNVAFSSSHQVVRDALESQAPRLKELMEQQGVDLTDVDVSDHTQQQMASGQEQGDGEMSQSSGEGEWQDSDLDNESQTITLQSDSLVDDFA